MDVFDVNGVLLQRIHHNRLQTPCGVALAPSNFGVFSGALLVGDSTTGQISAFDFVSGGVLGVLQDTTNRPLVVPQIHGMAFGSGNGNGPTNSLFFVSGGGTATQFQPSFLGTITAAP